MAFCRAILLQLGLCFQRYAMLFNSFNDMLAFMDTLRSTAENSGMLVTNCCAGQEDTGGTGLLTIDMHLISCSSLRGTGVFCEAKPKRKLETWARISVWHRAVEWFGAVVLSFLSLNCLNDSPTCSRRDQAILGSCRWKLLWMGVLWPLRGPRRESMWWSLSHIHMYVYVYIYVQDYISSGLSILACSSYWCQGRAATNRTVDFDVWSSIPQDWHVSSLQSGASF